VEGLVRVLEAAFTAASGGFRKTIGAQSVVSPAQAGGFVIGHALPFGNCGLEPGEPVIGEDGLPTLVMGGSGRGKTTYVRRSTAFEFTNGRTVVSLDFRGDGNRDICRDLAAMGSDAPPTALLDAGSETHVPPFDFLGHGGGSAFSRASVMRDVFKEVAEGWGVRIAFNALVAFLACAELGLGLTEIREILAPDGRLREYALERITDPATAASLRDYCSLTTEAQSTQWQEIANKLHAWIFQEDMRLMLGADSAPDLRRMLDVPGNVTLVSLGVSKVPAAALMGKLLVSAIVRHVMARAEVEKSDRPFFRLYVDELSNLGHIGGLEEILAEGRRLGASITGAFQESSQIPASLLRSFRANAATQIYFAAGAAEAAEAAAEVASDLPREAVRQEIMSLKTGQAIVVRRGLPAAKVQMPDFPVPTVSEAQLQRFTERALDAGCPTRETVRSILAARERWLVGLGDSACKPSIDHGRRPGRKRGSDE